MSDAAPEAPAATTTTSPSTLSPSAAALWSQCQQRWWFRYVDRLPEPPPGEPAVLGTFVHRILELLLAEPADGRSLEQARALARVAWAEVEASDDWSALDLDERAGRRFRQRAWATVEAYFSCESPADVRPVARELEVRAEVGGVPFRGFIDLVEEHAGTGATDDGPQPIVITDYKTGRPPAPGKPWSAVQDAERLLQPQWYAAALAATGEHHPVRARLLYFAALDDPRGPGFATRTREIAIDLTEASLDEAAAELRRRWDEIGVARERGTVESSPGPLCGWCPFVAVCEAGQAECTDRWNERDTFHGGRRLRDDAPAVALLGLDRAEPQPA